MSEHSKIPVPEADGKSLLERAVKAFDLGALAGAPVPTGLVEQRLKPAARRQAEPQLADTPTDSSFLRGRESISEPSIQFQAPETHSRLRGNDESLVEQVNVGVVPQATLEPAPAIAAGRKHPIDREHLRAQGLIVPEGSVTALLEEFRIVKRQLLLQAAELTRQGGGAAAQRILVCSPHPAEGKTYCSINLALSIAAEKESEVLLVDADFAKPSILSALGLPGGPGLMDALTDRSADVASFILATDIPGLSVLPAGNATNSDSENLNSSRTAAVLERLTAGAPNRIVIFDSPPALAAAPAAELAKYVGQAVMIVRADQTGQGALEDAISLLSGCPNIQLLLNAVNFSPSGRRFGSYYGYGE